MHQMQLPFTPDYQLKIPRSLQILLVIGALGALSALVLFWAGQTLPAVILLVFALIVGAMGGLLFMVTDPRARDRAREQMLAAVAWRGDEQVLDVGCGNGIILLSAAKHLTPGQGKATGIDIWVEGSGEQSMLRLRKNAALEGVGDRVAFQEVDARTMPFADASFDVIFASLSLHHVGNSADRQQAATEMLRVLKPGGAILIYDMLPIANGAAKILRSLGARPAQYLGGSLIRTLKIEKPSV